MSESNADKLREMYRRFWVDRDPRSGNGVLSPDIVWEGFDEVGLGGVRRGPREVGQFFNEWLEVWDATTNDFELEEVTRDVIVVTSRFRGRARTTGLEFEREIGQVYEFEDGLAVRQTMYATGEEARQAARSLTGV